MKAHVLSQNVVDTTISAEYYASLAIGRLLSHTRAHAQCSSQKAVAWNRHNAARRGIIGRTNTGHI